MSKHERPFLFKRFQVEHCKSSMKVGIDAVVLGAWAMLPNGTERVLDVGCGCGIISMMLAQRYPEISVLGIDIDEASVLESAYNFSNCEWSDRLSVTHHDFLNMNKKFDYIISNPPYFEDGIKDISTSRLKARHQDSLNPLVFVKHGCSLLKEKGRLSLVFPSNQLYKLLDELKGYCMNPIRLLLMAGRPNLEPKRCFIEFEKTDNIFCPESWNTDIATIIQTMYVRDQTGEYSDSYRALCKDFYLKF